MNSDRNANLAEIWLKASEADLSFAGLGLREGYYAHVCFTCQQAAEKALKAYLFAQGQELLRTHFLPRLLQECHEFDETFSRLADTCAVLTTYYTDTRYPDWSGALDVYDRGTAEEALELARQVVQHVSHAVGTDKGVPGQSGGDA